MIVRPRVSTLVSTGLALRWPCCSLRPCCSGGPTTAVYTLTFKSGLANQTLNLDWVAQGGGTAILSAVTLTEIAAPGGTLAPCAGETSAPDGAVVSPPATDAAWYAV